MDAYHATLFIHLLALLSAVGATSLMHFAHSRRERAGTARAKLPWHNMMMKTARTFPIALAVLVVTGGYMVQLTLRDWSLPFISAGLTGVVLLFVSGIALAVRGKGLQNAFEAEIRERGPDATSTLSDPFSDLLGAASPGLVLGVVFDMTLKPSLGICFAALATGAVLGILVDRMLHRAAATAVAPSEA